MLNHVKKGIGGLLFLLVTAIGGLTLSVVTALSVQDNVKYIVNQAAYFVCNKASVNLYNTNAPSGTYSTVSRVSTASIHRSPFNLNSTYNNLINDNMGTGIFNHMSSGFNVHWDRDTATLTANANPSSPDIGSIGVNGHLYTTMFNGGQTVYEINPNKIVIIMEK